MCLDLLVLTCRGIPARAVTIIGLTVVIDRTLKVIHYRTLSNCEFLIVSDFRISLCKGLLPVTINF